MQRPTRPRRPSPPLLAALALGLAAVACNGAAAERASGAGDAPPADAGDAGASAEAVVTFLPDGPRVLAEVADTPAERVRGLMYREDLADGHGMLFVFEEEALHTFWMRNTLIPLDMIFIDEGLAVVGIVHDAAPLTDDPREVDAPSRYVLEVPGGWARARGVEVGRRVRFEGPGAP